VKRLLRTVVHGEWLRHRPVALAVPDQRPVRAFTCSISTRDVTDAIFPVSLNPLVLGIARRHGEAPTEASWLRVRDAASGNELGSIALAPVGVLDHSGGFVDLLQAGATHVRCVPALYRSWRYATAWRHMKVNARAPNAFHIDFADLKALNIFYMMPRPVFLVTVRHGERGNLFPMDLVGSWGTDMFLLALRTSSRSIETILDSGRIAISAMPARYKKTVYALGSQHRQASIDWDSLGIEMVPSPAFGFPVPAQSLGLRELDVEYSQAVGSHRLFVTRIVDSSGTGDGPQLCHVSDMYARWRARQGTPFTDA
jgi:flavin reductase (DIM6/NTAB) family NADH-FMN oxidoreductase RutF